MLTNKKEDELVQWQMFYEENNNHIRIVKKEKGENKFETVYHNQCIGNEAQRERKWQNGAFRGLILPKKKFHNVQHANFSVPLVLCLHTSMVIWTGRIKESALCH